MKYIYIYIYMRVCAYSVICVYVDDMCLREWHLSMFMYYMSLGHEYGGILERLVY